MKGHTGAFATTGKGAVASKSSKQKINGGGSTDNEIIGVDHCVGGVLWTKHFVEAQGAKATALLQKTTAVLPLFFQQRRHSGPFFPFFHRCFSAVFFLSRTTLP